MIYYRFANNYLNKFIFLRFKRKVIIKNQICHLQTSSKLAASYFTKENLLGPFGIVSAVACGLITLVFINNIKKKATEKIDDNNYVKVKSIGVADIGGPLELTTANNEKITEKYFDGKWVLLYFGFTRCPDVCPDSLDKISEVCQIIEKTKKNNIINVPFVPIFISVDPNRDSPSIVKEYLKDFDSSIIGLTGSINDIKEICKRFRIYYSSGPQDSDKDYIVDHTIIMYLMDPTWKFVNYYGQDEPAAHIASDIIKNHKELVKNSS